MGAYRDGRILEATVLGPHADDPIHELALDIKAGLKTRDILATWVFRGDSARPM